MDRTTARVEHLVSAHGSRVEAFRTSNFPGYVDMNMIARIVGDALKTRKNGWMDSACETCEELSKR